MKQIRQIKEEREGGDYANSRDLKQCETHLEYKQHCYLL